MKEIFYVFSIQHEYFKHNKGIGGIFEESLKLLVEEYLIPIDKISIQKFFSDEEYLNFLQKEYEGTTILIDMRKNDLVIFSNKSGESVDKLLSDAKKGEGYLGRILQLYEHLSNEVAVFDQIIDLS
ncbi:MAG: hypothetical protein LBH96_00735 [Candidatus Peribacteria bacterium]|jgi:hypothetical protein|nr:hypothetical protein [Candidatus Peribacteria bacterium]